jgi:glycosyltransferase involved in cell wall biosynthesis
MRVLVVSQYFWPENFRINDLVAELARRGHQVTVLTGKPNYPDGKIFSEFLKNPGSFDLYKGARVVRVPMLPRGQGSRRLMLNYFTFALSAACLGPWKLRNSQYDVIFTCQLSPVTVGIPAAVMRAVKKVPMAFWILDLWPESLQAIGVVRSKLALAALGKLVSRIYNHCDLILAQSKSFVPAIAKYAGSEAPIEYFPSWSDTTFSAVDVKAAPEIQSKQGSFNIVFTGNIGEAQDFPAILAAAEKLKNYQNIRWLIVGDGRMAGWVANQIKIRGLESCVSMLGRYPVERMPSFFKHADALLVSLKDEPIFALTIPGKLQSYLAAGIPVLAMLNGEGAEVVAKGGAGLVCRAGEYNALATAVLRLTEMTSDERAAMGKRGLVLSKEEFGREKLIDQLEVWLKKLRFRGDSAL